MGELCRLTASVNDIHFNSREAAEEFIAIFEIGVVSNLAIQDQANGWNVVGHLTCLGSSENQKQGASANISDSDFCLAQQLKKRDLTGSFTLFGFCVRKNMPEERDEPVEHEGYLLDFKNMSIRDLNGQDHNVPKGQIQLLALLSQTPKPFTQLYNEYNRRDKSARPIGIDAFNGYLRRLRKTIGKDAIIRTSDNLVSLSAKK